MSAMGERIQAVYEKGNYRAGEYSNDMELKFRGVPVVMLDPASLKRIGTTWSYSFKSDPSESGQQPVEPVEPVSVTFEVLGEERGEHTGWKIQSGKDRPQSQRTSRESITSQKAWELVEARRLGWHQLGAQGIRRRERARVEHNHGECNEDDHVESRRVG